jgi:hypothetical protein
MKKTDGARPSDISRPMIDSGGMGKINLVVDPVGHFYRFVSSRTLRRRHTFAR